MARASDPDAARRGGIAVVRRLRQAGHTAYFAGGCVRDELLGLRPTDYDVATDATPNRVKALFERADLVGAAFGVALVRLEASACDSAPSSTVAIEVATFRADGPYSDARRPDRVTFSDPRTDAFRRDFTVNALFLDPLVVPPDARVSGTLIDYVDGLADIEAGVIRAVGDPAQRLAEDHLRALRAVRFASRLGFLIEPRTASAIAACASELRGVSRERIGAEVRRMLEHPSRADAADLMHSLGLLGQVLGAASPEPTEAAQRFELLRKLGASAPDPSSALSLSCLALDLGLRQQPRALWPTAVPSLVARWRKHLNLSNDESEMLGSILFGVNQTVDPDNGWPTWRISQKKRAAAASWFHDSLVVIGLFDQNFRASVAAEVAALAKTQSGISPTPFIGGDDLVALGYPPGPKFRTVLDQTYDRQLEGNLINKEQALEFARELWERIGV